MMCSYGLNLLHPDNELDNVEDVFIKYGIDVNGKPGFNARLAQTLLANMNKSESHTTEFSKTMKNAV